MKWRKAGSALAVLFVLGASLRSAVPAHASPSPLRPPVIESDAPDPAIATDGTTFFLFTTDTVQGGSWVNVPTYHSTNLTAWSYDGDALPTLGAWAQPGLTWAPSVIKVGAQWLLYYTAHHATLGVQCIGVAIAAQPSGPYSASSSPFVCQSDRGGSIDPSAFVDTDGERYLLWKSDDNAFGGTPVIWSQHLSTDGLTLTGNPKPLLSNDQTSERGFVEGPSLVKVDGLYWLFYSAGYYSSWDYSVGYAICDGPAGPCSKRTTSRAWMDTGSAGAAGPGGASLSTTPNGTVVMAVHEWRRAVGYENGGYRATAIEPVDFSSGVPQWRTDWRRTGGPDRLAVPVLSSSSSGSLDVFGAVGGGPLLHASVTGASWSGWESLGGGMIGGPGAVSGAGGTLDVFVHGLDGALWHRAKSGSSWSGWESLGGGMIGGPGAVSGAGGTLDVFVHGLDGALWHRAKSGSSWSGWESLGGGMIGGPGAVSAAGGTLDVFVHGLDGALWHRAKSGSSWSGWESLGGGMIGGPGAVSAAGGTLDVFVHGLDGALWHRARTGATWFGWESLGGGVTSDPSSASANPGTMTVAIGGLDGDAWARTWNGAAWSPWAKLLPSD